MEDVLEVYLRPHDPDRPVVCLDETTKQLIKQTRAPVSARPGRPARQDYEYERNGTANLFMLFAPLEGWRHVEVTDRHTALDYAQILKDLSDRHFPGASKIVLVQDNLNTHKPASLYEAFPAAEARRLVERFEWHYTPKHGSWLDMAESELSVLSRQCLDQRIPDKQSLIEEVAAWQQNRKCGWHDSCGHDQKGGVDDAKRETTTSFASNGDSDLARSGAEAFPCTADRRGADHSANNRMRFAAQSLCYARSANHADGPRRSMGAGRHRSGALVARDNRAHQ
jgi:hypothetical protein